MDENAIAFNPEIIAFNDYYPFGMLMPNRHGQADSYRYGFQGQEKDDEVKGEGNSINYKFRMHDPRVGRFFAVDPLASKYSHYTPYSFSGNKVIAYVELEGLEEMKSSAISDYKFHFFRVRKGDNLSNISKITGVALSDILKWNPQIKERDLIYPNDVIDLSKSSQSSNEVASNSSVRQSRINNFVAFWKELNTTNENGVSVGDQGKFVGKMALLALPFGNGATGIFSKEGAGIIGSKMFFSGVAQYGLNDKKVNVVSVIGDGFLNGLAADIFGNAFEVNINFNKNITNRVTTNSIFTNKSLSDFAIEVGVSQVIGKANSTRTNMFKSALGEQVDKSVENFLNHNLDKASIFLTNVLQNKAKEKYNDE
ncbi:RHS repeat-associated core domain-containing protein [Tenacibaculum sp. IB213877]|uniref:RHS repeat domain-containing protein n=1 Tax=Tenacibaculum sp. IB213877 TaxID=3097351 RepID=UPI002A59EF13|nr:RHS repeat-associated core domain-containing protein [Tenacibaculum sp. IB213877]MDY0780891.1 RHS repeat-associated core domain-containing protein [Tenacibaculum sp. IB213877]